jgi:addiction module HigA family antidote
MIHSPSHPGWLLAEELQERKITISKAASDLGVSRQSLSRIINGAQPITPEMAARLGHYFGSAASLWVRMQAQHDLWVAIEQLEPELENMPVAAAR